MARNYSRPLNTPQLAGQFIRDALGIGNKELSKFSKKIVDAERSSADINSRDSTLNSHQYRDSNFVNDHDRLELKVAIVNECLTKPRLDDDDDIRLGIGGCVPNGKLIQDRQAYIIIGPPASGKSSIANKVAEEYGAFILDSDYAKRKLPEFEDSLLGATVVHDESNEIMFGNEKSSGYPSVLELATSHNCNLVIPKVGGKLEELKKFIKILQAYDYEIHITLVYLDREAATRRALYRFIQTNRYVSLAYVFDICGNNPVVSYFFLKKVVNLGVRSWGIISTDVPKGSSPFQIESDEENPAKLFKPKV